MDELRGRNRYESLQSVLAKCGVELSVENLKRGYEESGFELQKVWDTQCEVPIFNQIQLILRLAAGREINLEHSWNRPLEEAYVNPIFSLPPKLSEEVPFVLQAVRERGFKIGLISNTGRSPGTAIRQLLANYGVLKFFDAVVFSNEVMRRKPDHEIFDRASEMLGTKSEAIVHIGDNPAADFWGARNAGMQAVLLDQPHPISSTWPSYSLFAITRAHVPAGIAKIEPRWRIHSLTEVLDLLDSL